MASEHRKNYFLGVSPGEWISIIVLIAGGVLAYQRGYSTLVAEVEASQRITQQNSEQIKSNHKEFHEGLNEIRQQIRNSEIRTRQNAESNFREIQRDIKELLKRGE